MKTHSGKSGTRNIMVAAAAFGFVGAAQAATVSVELFNDATPGTLFLAPVELSSSGNVTTFSIPLGPSGFTATASSSGAPVVVPVSDTISFQLKAASGFKITKVTYSENGSGTASGGGVSLAFGSASVGLISTSFPTAMYTSPSVVPWTFGPVDYDFSANPADSLPVAINNDLLAIAVLSGASATISKQAPTLTVETAPVPLPPAAWMLGSALVGLATVGRRKLG